MTASETFYRSAMSSRQIWKWVDGVAISACGFFQSVLFAVDNRRFVPPFVPFWRASDAVFGRLLRACTSAAVAYLPWSVWHCPWPPRVDDPGRAASTAGETYFAKLLMALMEQVQVVGAGQSRERSGCYRWKGAPGHCRAGKRELERRLNRAVASLIASEIAELRALLLHYGAEPEFWAKDVQRAIAAMEWRLESGRAFTVTEPGFRADGQLTRLRSMLRFVGRMMCTWPAIVEGALALRSMERKSARQLS